MHWSELDSEKLRAFRDGCVIPAHPLALNADRKMDRRRQRALSRYYIDAGVGGLAVGVHTTQFAIRDVGLYRPVLEIAAETAADWAARPILMVAGVAGPTAQALEEARTAKAIGYDSALVSLAALKTESEAELIDHCRSIAGILPVMGFYLQTAVGGRRLSRDFWRRLAEIDNVIGVKMAPFNRYATLDVARGIAEARAENRVSLYTGNDDHIVLDLLARHRVMRDGEPVDLEIVGGLLGHWCVWTKGAVDVLERCKAAKASGGVDADMMRLDGAVTDCNAAVFDAANDFHGVIAGCHEILHRQGLLEGRWCLDPEEDLGPGQMEELDRVYREYPDLNDDAFVAANLDRWLA